MKRKVSKKKNNIFIKVKDNLSANFDYYRKLKTSERLTLELQEDLYTKDRIIKSLVRKAKDGETLKNEIKSLGDRNIGKFIEEIEKLVKENNLLKEKGSGIPLQTKLTELEEPKLIKGNNLRETIRNRKRYNAEMKEFKKEVKKYTESLETTFLESVKHSKRGKPESYSSQDRQIKINDSLKRVYYLADMPSFGIMPGVFYRILNCPIPMTISIHIKETSVGSMHTAAKNTRSVYKAQQNERLKRGKDRDEELDFKTQQATEFIQRLVSGQEKAFLVSIYIAIEANSKEELQRNHNTFKNASEESFLTFNTYTYGQKQAYQSVLPLVDDAINKDTVMQTMLVAYFMPFLTRNNSDPDGIFLGRSVENRSLVLFDLFKSRNANVNILGTSGSGKSVTAKIMAIRMWLRQSQVLILDPEGEYAKITKQVEGQTVKFTRKHGINPFYIGSTKEEDFKDHIQTLKGFFKFFISDKNYDQAVLDEALVKLYDEGDLNYTALFENLNGEGEIGQKIARDLAVLKTGSLEGIFDSEEVLDLNKDWIVFDLSSLDTDEQKKPAMFLIASMVSRLIKRADKRRMMFIDEAHILLENEESAIFYKNLVKRARKYRAGIVSISQNVEDYFDDRWGIGKGIITNAETTFLLKQSFASLDLIANSFPITDSEKTLLPTLTQGEALLFREKEHMRLNIIPLRTDSKYVFT